MIRTWVKQFRLQRMFFKEIIRFWQLTTKYNASSHTDEDIQKMQYTLLRENHTIEKGLSMREPRRGFGQQKVAELMIRLNKYIDLYWDRDPAFLDYPLSTIKAYIDYTHESGINISKIENEYNKLLERTGKLGVEKHAGITEMTKKEVCQLCNKDFETLLYSRHSIRYFTDEMISEEILKKALTLAQQTPSACNRQGWLTHIFIGNSSIDLIKWQGGCRGFESEIRNSILVTANLKAFESSEIHQAYVDGGLYAMNLINALHSLGLGTIPLSCAFDCDKLKLLSQFNIPEYEVPIVIIGIGHLYEKFNVAVSERKEISKTNTFH